MLRDVVLPPGRHHWAGPNGLLQLRSTLRCTAPAPSAFRAEARVLAAAGVVLADWRSSQVSGEGPVEQHAALELVVVLAGRVHQRTPGSAFEAGPRSVFLLHRDQPRSWTVANGTHLRSIRISGDLVPAHLRATGSVPSGLLADSKLTRGFAAALTQGVSAAIDRDLVPAHLALGLQSLALAVLEELAPEDEFAGEDLRDRILGHVDRHLADASLSPRTISEAFGVSLRWVHESFKGDGITLARHIRLRRVDAVAEHLRLHPQAPRLSALAIRFGFSGREHLARAFRWRYGCTVHEFHDAVLAGDDRRPLDAPLDDRSDVA